MGTLRVLGTCHHDCPDTCGWIATSEDGVLTSVRGNPDHPYSQGELCPKVNRFVHRVNSPDRLLVPLIRTGPKGSGEYRESTWDEALERITSEFSERHGRLGGQTILPWWSAGTQGMIQENSLSRTLWARLGTSGQAGSICGNVAAHGMAAAYGSTRGADPLQLEHAELVVLWGTNTRLTNRHLWPWVEKARERGARIVVVDPMTTITADAADLHLQPLPGTDMALILAMMHVLIADDLLDHEYIRDHSIGFDELAASVADKTPEWAAPLCGIDADQIRDFAQSYGAAQPAFIRGLIGAEHHAQGGAIFRSLALLPVLTGSWRHRGGGFARSVGAWQEYEDVDMSVFDPPTMAAEPRRQFLQSQLARTLTDTSLETPITALFIWNGNPLVSMPNSALLRRGLEREDLFTVVSEQFMTDTASYADVILPAAMQTEMLDVVPSWGHLWLGRNEPATAPMGESVANTEMFRRLATAFDMHAPEHHLSDEELISLALGPHVDQDELRTNGFVRISGTDDLMPYEHGGFATASGRAEFASDAAEAVGQPRVPSWVPSVEGPGSTKAETYPLMLTTPKKQTRFLNTSYSGLEGHASREKGPFIEIDAADAAQRGLVDGAEARAFNERGSLTLPVSITDRLRPGLVSIPWGWVGDAYGSGLANDLTNDAETDLGGGASYGDTLIQVEAAPA
jgi:anaerobic selenocysteine-containing dehydrogenase